MNKVSIIIPVYNSEMFLPRLINSILTQTYQNFECIFVDDASTDKGVHLIEGSNDFRFYLIKNTVNKGAQECRKQGFIKSSGEFICFIDSDDYLHKNYLKYLVNKMELEATDIVMCNYMVINEVGKLIRSNNNVTPIKLNKFPLTARDYPQVILSKPAFWNKLYRKTFLDQYLVFPNVVIAQDLAIVPLLLAKGRISYVPELLYYYRIKANSISNSLDERLLNFQDSIITLSELKQEYPHELEFLALSHYYYQISKTLLIKDKFLRLTVYDNLRNQLISSFPNYQKNPYLKKRSDYRMYLIILKQRWLIKTKSIHNILLNILKSKMINNIIRKSDK